MPTVHIDVWSDVVCPWCFIGRRRLQNAIASAIETSESEVTFTVRHRAFQLNPAAEGTMPTSKLLSEKYRMDPAQVHQMQAQVCTIADREGLCYNLADTLSGNTRDAHRLLLWAESIDKQDELLEEMYSTYFEKQGEVFSHEGLLAVCERVDISTQAAAAILDSDEYSGQVMADQAQAQQFDANGVPFYVLNNAYGISGAQPLEVFIETINRAIQAAS